MAMVALATPAFALPDRYEQGYSCTGQGAMCTQQQLRLDDGNRGVEKARAVDTDDGSFDQSGIESSQAAERQAAARTDSDDNFGDEAGDEIENTADEAGDEISDTADEAGDEIENAADEAGDEISDAADEVGDAFD
ncbi:MAG TPA: hypothetical protein VJ790_06070 [Dongiaceae bacterium]|nr:hypothetical protein [Dongiaceae bacterium]